MNKKMALTAVEFKKISGKHLELRKKRQIVKIKNEDKNRLILKKFSNEIVRINKMA